LPLISLGMFILGFQPCYSQITVGPKDNLTESKYDSRLLMHYSAEELNDFKINNSLKFTTIEYYYTRSYIFEALSCTNCEPISLKEFDISKFEDYRLPNSRYELTLEKLGCKITLLSIDEMEYKPFRYK
ncbi:MAG: hypothetical protein K1X56_15170, partial [Flavobacteriales bacterium]|nr:hypothetical protein [Flavobacteriales bacterium]MBX7096060.1 hypothetical protein [Flavobacteriales bacterium]